MGSSKSQSASTTSTNDNRVVADGGAIAVSGSSGNTVNVTDGGIIEKALQYLGTADAANTERLNLLITAGAGLIQANNQNTQAVLEAKKAADTPATADQSRIMVYVVAAAALFVMVKK